MRTANLHSSRVFSTQFLPHILLMVCSCLQVICPLKDPINTFKNRLDKHWSNQEVLFDFNADLTGT